MNFNSVGREEVRCWNKELRFLKIGIYLMRVKLFGNWEAKRMIVIFRFYCTRLSSRCLRCLRAVCCHDQMFLIWIKSRLSSFKYVEDQAIVLHPSHHNFLKTKYPCFFSSVHQTVKTVRRWNCCPLTLWNVVSTVILYLYDYGNTQSNVHCFQLSVLWRQQISIAKIKECCLQN